MEEKKTRPGRNGGTLFAGGKTKGSGRPRRVLSVINQELEAQGCVPVTAGDFNDMTARILNMDLATVKAMIEGSDTPLALRIIGKRLLNEKNGYEAVIQLAERVAGKAVQKVEHTGENGEAIALNISIAGVTPEALDTDPD